MVPQAMGRGTPASAPPDLAPQLQAHLYYFPAPLEGRMRYGTNLRMSYCHFPTVLCWFALSPQQFIAERRQLIGPIKTSSCFVARGARRRAGRE